MTTPPRMAAALIAAFMAAAPALSLPYPAAAHSPAQRTLSLDSGFDGLIRHDGSAFDRRQLAGRPTLIFFGFTSCGTICPTALNAITIAAEELEKQYGAASVPNLLFVTTLPTHEGADQLKGYLKHFHPGLIGLGAQQGIEALTGDAAALARVRQVERLIERFRSVRNDHHSPFAYLMDGQGRFVGTPLNTQDDPLILAQSIARTLGLNTDLAARPAP